MPLEIDSMLNYFAPYPSQPYIATYSHDLKIMDASTTQPVKVLVKNFGGSATSNVYAKLDASNGFIVSQDSIYIGAMNSSDID